MCVLSPTPSVILPAVAAAVMWIVAGILQHKGRYLKDVRTEGEGGGGKFSNFADEQY